MTWINFLSSLSVVYTLYYVFNLLKDAYFSNRNKSRSHKEPFDIVPPKEPPPEKVAYISQSIPNDQLNLKEITPGDLSQIFPLPLVNSTGGVNFQDLLALINKEAIEYSKAIPY